MCGILGITKFNNLGINDISFLELLKTQLHRGPDSQFYKKSDDLILGNTRLAIIGLKSEEASLPIADDCAMLAFNGEIYNYKELNAILLKEKIFTKGFSDSETLFLLLKRFGVSKTLDLVDGMFAFAFYNKREKSLYLARDRVGERFLYWSIIKDSFIFSSEIKTFTKIKGFVSKPNIALIKDYFFTSKINGTKTFFNGINELEPGKFLKLNVINNNIKFYNYWNIEDTFKTELTLNKNDIMEEVISKLNLATSSRLVSDVPICFFLSGGIDSHVLLKSVLSTYESESIELFFADNFLNKYSELKDVELGIKFYKEQNITTDLLLNISKLSLEQYLDELNKLIWFYDEPIQFINSVLLSKLCRMINIKKYKVAFSGEGSDEIFFGYERFVRSNKLITEESSDEDKIKVLYYGGGIQNKELISHLVKNSGVANEQDSETWKWLKENINLEFNKLQLMYSQKFRLQMLLQRQDRVGMMHSLEIRTPYLAPNYLSYVNKIPMDMKYNFNNNITKEILKKAFYKKIPDRIINKKKEGFGSDMQSWIGNNLMKDEVCGSILNKNSFSHSYLDAKLVKSILKKHFDKKRDYSTLIWMMYSLEKWHKFFFDR